MVKLLREDENVEDVLTVNGYNMLSSSQNTYSSISFIILKDWGLRENADQSADALAQLYTKFGMSRPEASAMPSPCRRLWA